MKNTDNIATQTESCEPLQYDPNAVLDVIIQNLRLKNDAALARALEISPSVISKIRHYRTPIYASVLLKMHDASDLSIRELRHLMGDKRDRFGSLASQCELENSAPCL